MSSDSNNNWLELCNDNCKVDIAEKFNNMPYKNEMLKYDEKYFENIICKSQSSLFNKMKETLFQLKDHEYTSLQLKILKALLYFYHPILIETYYDDNNYDKNIIGLSTLILPNSFYPSVTFLSNLKILSNNTLQSFLINQCSIFKQLNIIDDVASIICYYVQQITQIFQYHYPNNNKQQYPKSIHHGPYYCFVKTIIITKDFIAIEFDEHGDSKDDGAIQSARYSLLQSSKESGAMGAMGAMTDEIKCGKCKQQKCTYWQTTMATFVTCLVCGNRWKCRSPGQAKYESEFEYDVDHRVQGRLIYEKVFDMESLKTLTFTYGEGGYSTTKLYQNEMQPEITRTFT